MPAALDVNREAVRVLCVEIGVRETARRMNLPESTVKSWCTRGDWLRPVVQPPTVLVASNASNPAEVLANLHAENSIQTKTSLGKAVVKAAKTFEDMDGPEIIEKGQQLRHVAASGSQVFGWEDRKAADAGLVSVTLVRLELSETRNQDQLGDAADRAKVAPCHELP